MIKRYLRIYAGSFLMWEDEADRQDVLSLKYYDTQGGSEGYKYKHYKVKTDKGEVYFTKERKYDNRRELMNSWHNVSPRTMSWKRSARKVMEIRGSETTATHILKT